MIDPRSWTRRVRTGAVNVDDMVDPARVIDHYANGATVVLQSLQRWWPPIARFCRDLERTLTHAVQANAYLTGPGAVGLAPHHDTHDVFVLQLHGTKQWTLREPLVEAPLRRHRSRPDPSGRQPVLLETELRPGTCMYLPRGVIHSAATQEDSSLHLTIGVLATTAADVVHRIAHLAGDVPSLRRDLPPGWAAEPAVTEQIVKEIMSEFAAFAGSLDATALSGHMVDRFVASRAPVLEGHLVDIDRSAALDDHTEVVRRDHIGLRIDIVDGDVHVELPDRTVELPGGLESAVSRLLDGRSHAVGQLSDLLDAASRQVLVRRLVREGVLRIEHDD